ncbi:MAG: helix-turn-helix domain-containing protein [Chloroflexi bacterium]|uniref:Helix-turn-helix domain-containing protein n=2 Tax=Candidatus Chlorohelix allophototropha TaxID=3003348 RepID=A0A8T7M2R6_9CHLR|nr:helix-turn-helix domain-containing protein [Chloroflexota bacterium]
MKGVVSHPIDRKLIEMGQTRRWLAEQTRLSHTTIRRYCTWQVRIRPNNRQTRRICDALGVTLNYLVGIGTN